jgi:hypothetical protein
MRAVRPNLFAVDENISLIQHTNRSGFKVLLIGGLVTKKRQRQSARCVGPRVSYKKSEGQEPESDEPAIARWTRLQDIPIEDSLREKTLIEGQGSYRSLYPQAGIIVVSPDCNRRRIIEIYRLSYENSDERSQYKVIRDFIAHFPHLIFEADWLRELFIRHVAQTRPEFSYNSTGNKLLRTAIDGFRGAAYMRGGGDKSEIAVFKEQSRKARLSAARFVQHELRNELTKWERSLQRNNATEDWINDRETEKIAELLRKYTKLSPFERELKKLLHCRHLYKISIVIASKQFGVRARNLEQKSDRLF